MNRTDVGLLFALALGLGTSACGAAPLAIKTPIANQCASAGLKGCPELTDGVMDCIGGDKELGEKHLRAAAAARQRTPPSRAPSIVTARAKVDGRNAAVSSAAELRDGFVPYAMFHPVGEAIRGAARRELHDEPRVVRQNQLTTTGTPSGLRRRGARPARLTDRLLCELRSHWICRPYWRSAW